MTNDDFQPSPGLGRILTTRLRQAINDPSRYTDRRDGDEPGDRATRAAVKAVDRALFENDLHLVPGKRLHELETLESDRADREQVASVTTTKQPQTLVLADIHPANLAFYVRDLLAAAGYRYSPDGPLHGQVRECCELIEGIRTTAYGATKEAGLLRTAHAAEVQRLTDLLDELRKRDESRESFVEKLAAELTQARTQARRIAEQLRTYNPDDHADNSQLDRYAESLVDRGTDLGDDPDGDIEGAD